MSTITVVSGPSGVGKGTLLKRVHKRLPRLEIGVSWTTRDHRPGDDDGFKIYRYVTRDEFLAELECDGFMEWAEYSGHLYGTHIGSKDSDLLLEIETQGAQQIARAHPDALLVGILPPGESLEDQMAQVRLRLTGRKTDTPAAIEKRLATAPGEIKIIRREWPHIVINNDLDGAEDELFALVESYLKAA